MTEDHARSVTVKRNSKKPSGYSVEEHDGEYFIADAPSKARVNVGDKVVGINGIKADELADEDDANGLIESIRIAVVPQDEVEDYDAAKAAEEGGVPANGHGAPSGARGGGPIVHHCHNCEHDNEDLSEDEDGDLVCEECGHVIEEANDTNDAVHTCVQCGHENHNLERDEDGDLVCEECGYVIPEDNTLAVADADKKSQYPCPDCGHITINPESDDEGDRICEECGCILAEKVICECEACGYENVDPEQNEDGEYICENCEAGLEIEPQKSAAEKLKEMSDAAAGEPAAAGQEFDENGKPLTNKEGKKLTPADMFKPGDVITVTVGKSNPKQDCGLKLEQKGNGKYYVRKVPPTGLFARTPVIAGDKLLELNGKDAKDFSDVVEMKKLLKEEGHITVVVLRRDPDASESSASTNIDYDNLAPITPDGVVRDEIEDKDDDTVGYNGKDCGCVWCPDCHV